MPSKPFRTALVIVAATVAVLLAVGLWFYAQWRAYPGQRHHGKGDDIAFTVAPRMPLARVAKLLAARGVISHPTWFRLYAMRRGATSAIKPGDYLLADNLKPKDVLDALIKGPEEKQVSVTLPEGKQMLEYFALLDAAGVAKASELEALARDPQFIGAHGLSGDSVDGYLFPDTYKFVAPTPPKKVLERLINAQRVAWNQVKRDHARDLAKLEDRMKWSDRDVLILASIVEKEAVDPAERPRIAQVFVNRLTVPGFSPRRLETDPTIRYGCEVPVVKSAACRAWNTSDRLHRAQLDDDDNPYNTYRHEGLPPGPICNPGRSSMAAAMDPDGSDYLYFVARDARNHAFARTAAEHERNVQRYMQLNP
ncbi:MAG TPA: endolytic transglycosylase MltG [Kofleriaceae bacterium]|nr:endolytic transglycosylase MltG [Kofleriaceae bacterium]